jgi:hypothetical protein
MKKIHLVWGYSGEYSDRQLWLVAAYTERRKALRHAELARICASYGKTNPYDKHMSYDPVTGVDYDVSSVMLREELPKVGKK